MAKAKKSAVQSDTPAAGHNSADSAEQERRVLFFIDRKAYLDALAAKKAADAKLKNVCKTIKSDLGEYGLDQIKAYEKLQTPEGKAEITARHEAERQAMRFAGMAINTQLDIFKDRTPLIERAYRDGETAGLEGQTLSNPFNEASEEGREFARGWHDGQGALFAGIKQKEVDASPDEVIKGADAEDPFAEAAE